MKENEPGTTAHKIPFRTLLLKAVTATISRQMMMIRNPNRTIFAFISPNALASSINPSSRGSVFWRFPSHDGERLYRKEKQISSNGNVRASAQHTSASPDRPEMNGTMLPARLPPSQNIRQTHRSRKLRFGRGAQRRSTKHHPGPA